NAVRPVWTRMSGALYWASGTNPPTEGAKLQSGRSANLYLSANAWSVAPGAAWSRVVTRSHGPSGHRLTVRSARRPAAVHSSTSAPASSAILSAAPGTMLPSAPTAALGPAVPESAAAATGIHRPAPR